MMRKTTIIFSLLLGLLLLPFLSNVTYAGFGFGLPSIVKERVENLDEKIENEKKVEESGSATPGKAMEKAQEENDLYSTEGTGIEFLDVSPEISSLTLAATTSTTLLGDLYRFPTKIRKWVKMRNKEAYFRDVLVGQVTHIYNAVDGDEWSCEAILPDGSVIRWPTLRFYSSYAGETNCFVAEPFWKVCGVRNISILWYTTAQCAPTGTWTFRFYYKGALLFSDHFELLPQIPPQTYPDECVPLHNQRAYNDPQKDIYDHIPPFTISQTGCALTCAVMVLGYHEFHTTPRELNEWLKNYKNPQRPGEVGYTSSGAINWIVAVDRYSKGKVKFTGWAPRNDAELEHMICGFGPQIARVRYAPRRTHFVVMTGRDMDRTTWLINDPVNGVATMLNNPALPWGKNEYNDIRTFAGPEYTFVDQWCRIWITFHSPGELVITDPLGRREGYDPISNTLYTGEIPSAGYGTTGLFNADNPDEPLPEGQELDIWRPVEGEYELKVIGTETKNYDLMIDLAERAGGGPVKNFSQIPISPNEIHTYLFNYSREAGAKMEVYGGFDGKGQRPRDVNKFLSYSSPTQVTTELPPGVKTFNLFIFYDQAIIPGTFKAELNKQDITNLFSPSAGGHEVVKLNLAPGRNTLILSVDGTLVSGRKATDRDRLVFIVP